MTVEELTEALERFGACTHAQELPIWKVNWDHSSAMEGAVIV